ncbi:MAG TPA: nuclear transport factor 2 family protein [Casimicrobiaceae bacterium]|nr:nuclear transport factor 2 family protein [Casimicrobiaceae bacterium]
MQPKGLGAAALLAFAMIAPGAAGGTDDDSRVVADLDTAYQAAVERNDWRAMDRILHPDFVLVIGNGTAITRAQLIDSARNPIAVYEKQVEMPSTQKVRLFGRDTAVVTALLWLKGARDEGKTEFDYKLWFSDTYVRTPEGWKYAFGQASLRLPKE